MTKAAVSATVKQYIMSTTLHGFKYLYSTYYIDRIGWLLCFCASACCAGILCAVLWQRFLAVPDILVVWDKINEKPPDEKIPTVYICPTVESVAKQCLDEFTPNSDEIHRIAKILEQLVNGITVARSRLEVLDNTLEANNVSLTEALMQFSPNCSMYVKTCRYQGIMVPCGQLFEKEQTIWGICCVMNSKKLLNLPQTGYAQTLTTQTMDFVIDCAYGRVLESSQFFTSYEQEVNVDADILRPGHYYRTQLSFISTPEQQVGDNLLDSSCVSDKAYTKTLCMLECAEAWCGCRDPLHKGRLLEVTLPICSVAQMLCIRSEYKSKLTCNCLPTCKRINTFRMWESSQMKAANSYTVIDPIYANLNMTSSIVLNLRINVGHSHIFHLNPTETWLTLLSSLGGVFNMFLGIGLFSALEFLFFIFIKLPKAVKKSSVVHASDTRHVSFARY